MRVTKYMKPESLADALAMKESHPDAHYIAGGTDLLVQIRSGQQAPQVLISIRDIDILKGISVGRRTMIGSMTTINEILGHKRLGDVYPVLIDACSPFASMQIRNVATVGGNICNASPGADLAPALLVLGSVVCVTGSGGDREIPIEDFFLGPGETCLSGEEIVTAITIEPPSPESRAACMRKSRVRMDLALVSVAVMLEMKGDVCERARVAAGAVAPVPARLRSVEDALEGSVMTEALLKKARGLAERGVSPITDVRTDKEYRCHMTGVLFQRAAESILGWGDR